MAFHLTLTPMDPLIGPPADLPTLSIASLGSTSLIIQIRLDDPPPYSPTSQPRSTAQGVILILRSIRRPPRIPPSLRHRHRSSITPTPTPSPPPRTKLYALHRGSALKRQPRAVYLPPPKSLSINLFSTLPFVFAWGCALPAPPRPRSSSKRRRDDGDVDGTARWAGWLFGTCRRMKRRTI